MFTRKNLVNVPPKAILLYMNIVYAALSTIEELAKTPKNGNLSKIPYKDKNSPTKFRVSGTPQLPSEKTKKSMENKGINCEIPL